MTPPVVLVGAGPGDPDLLTVRAARELERAEVLLYDALIEPALLDLVPPECERIDVGKRGDGTRGVAQDRIADLLILKAREGKRVVRLKGGDPFVFGRGGEEASALVAAGIPFEVVPGISSPIAVPAYAGIPVTDRRFSSSVAVVTGHRGSREYDHRIDWEGLARSAETLVVLMGTTWLEDIVRRVVEGGRDPATPAAVIESGTTPHQRVVTAPLTELASRVREAGLRAPTVLVVGEVVRFRESLRWFEARPLWGRRVLLLRAADRAADMRLELLRRGAAPVHVPLLEFVPPEDPAPLERALARLAGFDWLVFTSATAVAAVAERLGERRPAAGRPRIACIGPATTRAARAAGLTVDASPQGQASPRALVHAMRKCGDLAGACVLFPAAEGAREALGTALEAAGAQLERVVAYRTRLPAEAPGALAKALDAGVDAVAFTSPSSVEHLVEITRQRGLRALARSAVLACIGPTTAARLRESGVEPAVVAERQTGEDLVEALARHFASSDPERSRGEAERGADREGEDPHGVS